MPNLPVRPSANPKLNAPIWGSVSLGTLASIVGLTTGWPVWAVVVVIAVAIAGGVATQVFTRPNV